MVDTIIDAANTETWRIHTVTGAVLNKFRQGNTENELAGKPDVRDFLCKEDYIGERWQRQISIVIQLFDVVGIGCEDKPKCMDWMMPSLRSFDASVSLVLTYDKALQLLVITQFGPGSLALC